jgi:hypothetical protein
VESITASSLQPSSKTSPVGAGGSQPEEWSREVVLGPFGEPLVRIRAPLPPPPPPCLSLGSSAASAHSTCSQCHSSSSALPLTTCPLHPPSRPGWRFGPHPCQSSCSRIDQQQQQERRRQRPPQPAGGWGDRCTSSDPIIRSRVWERAANICRAILLWRFLRLQQQPQQQQQQRQQQLTAREWPGDPTTSDRGAGGGGPPTTTHHRFHREQEQRLRRQQGHQDGIRASLHPTEKKIPQEVGTGEGGVPSPFKKRRGTQPQRDVGRSGGGSVCASWINDFYYKNQRCPLHPHQPDPRHPSAGRGASPTPPPFGEIPVAPHPCPQGRGRRMGQKVPPGVTWSRVACRSHPLPGTSVPTAAAATTTTISSNSSNNSINSSSINSSIAAGHHIGSTFSSTSPSPSPLATINHTTPSPSPTEWTVSPNRIWLLGCRQTFKLTAHDQQHRRPPRGGSGAGSGTGVLLVHRDYRS